MLGAFPYRGANIDIGFDDCSCSDSDYSGAGSYSDAADEWWRWWDVFDPEAHVNADDDTDTHIAGYW